jgi:hypothetical protein
MERRLESIQIKYWQKHWDTGEDIKYAPFVIVTYKNIVENIPPKIDTIVISIDTDYSIYEEKIQKICQIAFEEL